MINILSCVTCAAKVPDGIIILIGSISLVVLLFLLIGKIVIKIKELRRVKNASV